MIIPIFMAKLEFIVDLLTWKNDKATIKNAFRSDDLANTTYKDQTNTFLSRVNILVKPIIRGGLYGAGAGTLVSLITHNDVSTGAIAGAWVGAIADSVQYSSRAAYYGLKSIYDEMGARRYTVPGK